MNLVKSITRSFTKQKPGAKAAVIVVIVLAQCCICILPFTVMSITSGGEMAEVNQPAAAQQEVSAQQEVAAAVEAAAYNTAAEGDAGLGLAWLRDRLPAFASAFQWMAAVPPR